MIIMIIVFTHSEGFIYSFQIKTICTQLYGLKYSYQIKIICTLLYGFKYSYLILIIAQFQLFQSNIGNLNTIIRI